MVGKNFSLLFYLKKPKQYVTGEITLYMRITIDGGAKEISTSRKWNPNYWNQEAERAIGKKEETKEFNNYLNTLQMKVYEARRLLIEGNKPVTAEGIKNLLTGQSEKPMYLLEIFQNHNDQMEALVGREFALGTLERYKTSLAHTRAFIQWKYKVSDFDIKKIDYGFISEYEFWLKSVRKCNHNSTMKYLANFKKVVIRCIRNGWLTKDPFAGFKLTRREVERTALTREEIQIITDKNFSAERLNHVRDIFLFSCFTGLAYVDVKKLKRSEIGMGVDGEKWIFTNRQKTETASRIPLLPFSLVIMDKYKDHPQCVHGDKLLPVLTNQKMNAYLKEIADLCGLRKNLT
jgi:hypothetical protein